MRRFLLAAAGILSLLAASPAVAADSPRRIEKMDLWRNDTGPHLRGAAVSQRVRYDEVDGDSAFFGDAPVGIPFKQEDFDRLATRGANVVLLSHPGPFREKPPYEEVRQAALDNLDRLIGYARKADLFVILSFRTGPGRSDFTFHPNSGDTWFPKSLFNDRVWAEKEAQKAWAAMWRFTAERYRDDPVVVGYELMTEPNSHLVGSGPDDRIEIYDPARFHKRYGGTLYDWNQMYPAIVKAIREVDRQTPILIPGNGYGSVAFLPYVVPVADSRTVYTAHQYEPWRYTGQDEKAGIAYPGRVDQDDDGRPDPFDRGTLEKRLAILEKFRREKKVPIAITEFGVNRWSPGAERFLDDQMGLFEQLRFNAILWHWPSTHRPYETVHNNHNYFYGPDPASKDEVADSATGRVIQSYWARNALRPSKVRFPASAPAP